MDQDDMQSEITPLIGQARHLSSGLYLCFVSDGTTLPPGGYDGWYTFGFAYIPIVSDAIRQLISRFLQINCDGEPFPLTSGRGSVCLIRVETTILPPPYPDQLPLPLRLDTRERWLFKGAKDLL
jgi:hypothetical protein